MRFSTRTGLGRVFAAEAVVTFVPVLVITAVTTDNKVPRGAAAVAIGAALAAAILISGPISGAGVNPARAIGPMILTGPFTGWWVPDRTGHRRRASRHHLLSRKASTTQVTSSATEGPGPT
jgi:glycerol uptake facilitator-like aquaporin